MLVFAVQFAFIVTMNDPADGTTLFTVQVASLVRITGKIIELAVTVGFVTVADDDPSQMFTVPTAAFDVTFPQIAIDLRSTEK